MEDDSACEPQGKQGGVERDFSNINSAKIGLARVTKTYMIHCCDAIDTTRGLVGLSTCVLVVERMHIRLTRSQPVRHLLLSSL
jgi:hypothetical protein